MMETYRQNVIGPWKVTKVYIISLFLSRNLYGIKIHSYNRVFFLNFENLVYVCLLGIFTSS